MPPLPGPPDTRSKLRRALGIVGAAFCVLVAIGVAALFLALMSARKAGGAEQPSRVVAEGYQPAGPLPLQAARCGVDPSSAPHLLVANLGARRTVCSALVRETRVAESRTPKVTVRSSVVRCQALVLLETAAKWVSAPEYLPESRAVLDRMWELLFAGAEQWGEGKVIGLWAPSATTVPVSGKRQEAPSGNVPAPGWRGRYFARLS
jgi:hypothetical protein